MECGSPKVYPGQAGEKAGFRVGDIIVAVDGGALEVSQSEDDGVFELMIRRKSIGDEVKFDILREGKPQTVKMKLKAPPQIAATPTTHTDADFEFSTRDLTYQDRICTSCRRPCMESSSRKSRTAAGPRWAASTPTTSFWGWTASRSSRSTSSSRFSPGSAKTSRGGLCS